MNTCERCGCAGLAVEGLGNGDFRHPEIAQCVHALGTRLATLETLVHSRDGLQEPQEDRIPALDVSWTQDDQKAEIRNIMKAIDIVIGQLRVRLILTVNKTDVPLVSGIALELDNVVLRLKKLTNGPKSNMDALVDAFTPPKL